jgi:glycosyltransferase involved in cell wall biosynthesis
VKDELVKIAIIGNMNNNGFSLMRYFRDLGVDAHLLLFTNDGEGNKDHFDVLADTNYPEKWLPFIHTTRLRNSEETIAGSKYKYIPLGRLKYFFRWILQMVNLQKKKNFNPVTKKKVLKEFLGYSHYIGCGISPALLHLADMKLDIFYPYSIGVEFNEACSFLKKYKLAKAGDKLVLEKAKLMQSLGIKSARNIFCSQSNFENNSFQRIGVKHQNIMIPCVYLEKKIRIKDSLENKYSTKNLNFLHSARLFWQRPPTYTDKQWRLENKNNQWFFEEFAKVVQTKEGKQFHLFIIEYGPDIDSTKLLFKSLGLNDNVTWLKKMKRKDIISLLLNKIHVAVGEFYTTPQMIWGGTGWEALATGTPLLQGFNFTEDDFKKRYGFVSPGFIKIRKKQCINDFFKELLKGNLNLHKISIESINWFNRNNGLNLAQKWLSYLKTNSTF